MFLNIEYWTKSLPEELIKTGLELAILEAEKALKRGNVPIGCVITDLAGNVISEGQNETKTEFDTTAHAEIVALRKAGKKVLDKYNPEKNIIFTTLEPCFGCGFFLIRSNIKTIVWALSDDYFGSIDTYLEEPKMKDYYEGLHLISEPIEELRKKSSDLMVEYYKNKGDNSMAKKFKSWIQCLKLSTKELSLA